MLGLCWLTAYFHFQRRMSSSFRRAHCQTHQGSLAELHAGIVTQEWCFHGNGVFLTCNCFCRDFFVPQARVCVTARFLWLASVMLAVFSTICGEVQRQRSLWLVLYDKKAGGVIVWQGLKQWPWNRFPITLWDKARKKNNMLINPFNLIFGFRNTNENTYFPYLKDHFLQSHSI